MARKKTLKYSDNKLTELEYSILESFFPEAEEMTIKRIIERCGYSYERVNTSLKKLEKKQIIFSKKVGKTFVYIANYSSLYLRLAFHHYIVERKIEFANNHLLIFKSLKEISEETLGIILLFGSYSKGSETKNSDIDLMVVSDYSKKIEERVNKIKNIRGLNIALVNIKISEFPKIKKENPELWKDLRNYAIVFSSINYYYYWMYQNANN